ncbi:MAG: PqqD family protein [Nitrospirales bacterium]
MLNDLNISMKETSSNIQSHVPIDLDSIRIMPNADVHCTVLEGEAVLLHLKNGHYYTLNQVGTTAWEQLAGKSTLKEVHQVICSRFDVSADQAMKDLMALVNHLSEEGLIQQERG